MPPTMPHLRCRHEHVHVRDAAQIIDALNEALALDAPPDDRVQAMLKSFQSLLRRENIAVLVLLEQLQRDPAPLAVRRFVQQPSPEQQPVLPDAELQQGVDRAVPLAHLLMRNALAELRTPYTIICGEERSELRWMREEFLPLLESAGYADAMISAWAESPGRAMTLSMMRRQDDAPFTESDRTLMSLMLRAMAPMVDRELFTEADPLGDSVLGRRERQILMLLLAGDTEKEIAAKINRSPHTVHTYVKKIYSSLGVSSRGELMAMFIDREVVRRAAG